MENKDFLNTSSDPHFHKIYKDPVKANKAYEYLVNNGYSADKINIIMSDATRERYFNNKDLNAGSLGTKAIEGMGVGGTIGGTVGAIAAAIAAAGTILSLPGLGIIVSGPLAASFAGAGAGGALGTLIGGLVGTGIPSNQATIYEDDIKNGGVLIGVKTSTGEELRTLESGLNNL